MGLGVVARKKYNWRNLLGWILSLGIEDFHDDYKKEKNQIDWGKCLISYGKALVEKLSAILESSLKKI